MRKTTPEVYLPQYEGPRTARMVFDDVLGDLTMAAARYGNRTGEPYEEVDYWERSPAGKHVALTVYGKVQAEAAELAVYSPTRTARLIAAVRSGIIGLVDLNDIVGLDFLMLEPQQAVDNNQAEVTMTIEFIDNSTFAAPLSYEQFETFCNDTGAAEQTPLPRSRRAWNWVMAHTVKRPKVPEGWE